MKPRMEAEARLRRALDGFGSYLQGKKLDPKLIEDSITLAQHNVISNHNIALHIVSVALQWEDRKKEMRENRSHPKKSEATVSFNPWHTVNYETISSRIPIATSRQAYSMYASPPPWSRRYEPEETVQISVAATETIRSTRRQVRVEPTVEERRRQSQEDLRLQLERFEALMTRQRNGNP